MEKRFSTVRDTQRCLQSYMEKIQEMFNKDLEEIKKESINNE